MFKVGDKVRRRDGGKWGNCHDGYYDVVTVSKIDGIKIYAKETRTWRDVDELELEEKKNWHPHHDLIIEWLENEGCVVEFYSEYVGGWNVVNCPSWYPSDTYRIVYPNRVKQSEISKIEDEMRKLADRLKELKDA